MKKVLFPPEETVPAAMHDSPVAQRAVRLVVASGDVRGTTLDLPLAPRREVKIGKAASNDLVLPDGTVSRAHCVLRHEGGEWLLCDLGSTNGTFVGDLRIKETFIRPGSAIKVGSVEVRFDGELVPVTLAPSPRQEFGALCGTSTKMREIFTLLERIADSDAAVMITGETGTGKGAVARAIHEQSKRAGAPFIVVDCAAVAASLIESELFGHERGAFTSAIERRIGALEQAEGGTLFLDELDDLRKDLQPKLLRALEERTFQRVGARQTQRFHARVIAASKKDVRALVKKGTLRDDLYFRLAIFRVDLPPLRQRKEDLPLLVGRFAEMLGASRDAWQELTPDVRARLAAHKWPGNIRELRNTIDRAFALGGGAFSDEGWDLERGLLSEDEPFDVDFSQPFKEVKTQVLDRLEREYLTRLLAREGNMSSAARSAGVARRHLYTLLEKHGLRAGEDEGSDDSDDEGH
jgi:DNA-binding NtrC family response regulator